MISKQKLQYAVGASKVSQVIKQLLPLKTQHAVLHHAQVKYLITVLNIQKDFAISARTALSILTKHLKVVKMQVELLPTL